MKRLAIIIIASFGLLASCTDSIEDTTTPIDPNGQTGGDENNTFNHENQYDVWDLIRRLTEEGPPELTSHLHSCAKVRYATLGNVLTQLGVNITDTTPLSAGDLYQSGFNALGGPNYSNRIRENISVSTSGASREFDIFAAAADQIITAVPTLARCGGAAQLFDATTNACRADGITCITGYPAQAAHLDFCNLAVSSASDVATGKRLAVASILAAAYICE